MSEKISLTAQTVSRLPDPDGETAVRFCPKCGRRIPADRDRCAACANTGEIPRPRLPLKQKLRHPQLKQQLPQIQSTSNLQPLRSVCIR